MVEHGQGSHSMSNGRLKPRFRCKLCINMHWIPISNHLGKHLDVPLAYSPFMTDIPQHTIYIMSFKVP